MLSCPGACRSSVCLAVPSLQEKGSLPSGEVFEQNLVMAEELETLWQKLSLTKEEDENIVLWSSSTKAAKELVKNYQVMKILSRKSVMLDALQKNLRMIWKPSKGV